MTHNRTNRGRHAAEHQESSLILLFGYLLQPLDSLAIKRLRNRNMRHTRGRRRAVPMFFARGYPDHIARPNFVFRPAVRLHPTVTGRDDERLAERMRVPRGARARLERDE